MALPVPYSAGLAPTGTLVSGLRVAGLRGLGCSVGATRVSRQNIKVSKVFPPQNHYLEGHGEQG